ncbi:hypothetical protein [Candidatus Nitrotoga fabula]|uniref:hypothetical protein n=1 Tax=Candidatus Nitrotoga fabula TaxID=2182327 RepID=UPI001BB477D9|nr:hypothetical protein [Candidatus Nitrotoga fabula]
MGSAPFGSGLTHLTQSIEAFHDARVESYVKMRRLHQAYGFSRESVAAVRRLSGSLQSLILPS